MAICCEVEDFGTAQCYVIELLRHADFCLYDNKHKKCMGKRGSLSNS